MNPRLTLVIGSPYEAQRNTGLAAPRHPRISPSVPYGLQALALAWQRTVCCGTEESTWPN